MTLSNPSPDTGAGTPLTDHPDVWSEGYAAGWAAAEESRPATDPAGLDARLREALAAEKAVIVRESWPSGWEPVDPAVILARLSVADGPGPEERPDLQPRQEGEADECPTCGLASCIGRFQDADCDHDFALPEHREETGRS